MTILDTSRHDRVFSRDAFGKRRIDVIGAGATGARVVNALSKLGVTSIHVWDFDKVEAHNIANQPYSLSGDIGSFKVDALHSFVLRQAGLSITAHKERVNGNQPFGDVVFLLTDTMSSRKEIWQKGLRYQLRTKLMVETRMAADEFRIYAINPSKPSHVREWEATLYDDDQAEVSACGTTISVGATADILAGWAVWQFIQWFAIEQGAEYKLYNEILVGLRNPCVASRQF